jgi:hypothetical protein
VDLVTAANDLPAADVFGLESNYPNPFNPQTTIRYSLGTASRVSLRIFDLQGRLVRTLVDETQERGEHQVIWHGRNDRDQPVASGTYLYRIRAGDFVENRRMTLLK